MDKRLEDFQFTVGILFLLMLTAKTFKVFQLDTFILVFTCPLIIFLLLLSLYHLITKWRYSVLLSMALFFMTMVEAAALIAVLFNLFFWKGIYSMTLSAFCFYALSFLLILIFYFVSGKKIFPFRDYEYEATTQEDTPVPGLDGSLEAVMEYHSLNLRFEWIKFFSLFGLVVFFYFTPIDTRIDLFANHPEKVRGQLKQEYYQEKANLEKRNPGTSK